MDGAYYVLDRQSPEEEDCQIKVVFKQFQPHGKQTVATKSKKEFFSEFLAP